MRLTTPGFTVKLLPLLLLLFCGCSREPAELLELYLAGGEEAAEAGDELVAGGGEALDVLLPAFDDPADRGAVSRLLERMGEPAARRLLEPLLGDDDDRSQAAAEVLIGIGAPAVPPLAEHLDPQTEHVADVVFTLSRIGDPAWQPLIDAYADTTDVEYRGLLSAAFYLHGNAFLARRLLERLGPGELTDDLLTTVVLHLPVDELAHGLAAETAWRLLTFNPLEPLTERVIELARSLSVETRSALTELAAARAAEEPFQSSLVLMHLSALEQNWLDCADYGVEPFGTLVLRLERARESGAGSDETALLATALLHHGSIFLNYLVEGAESPAGDLRLAELAGEVTRRLEPLL